MSKQGDDERYDGAPTANARVYATSNGRICLCQRRKGFRPADLLEVPVGLLKGSTRVLVRTALGLVFLPQRAQGPRPHVAGVLHSSRQPKLPPRACAYCKSRCRFRKVAMWHPVLVRLVLSVALGCGHLDKCLLCMPALECKAQ